MADLKISQLTQGVAIDGTELIPVVQGGATVYLTAAQLRQFFPGLTGSQPRDLGEKALERVSLLDFMNSGQREAWRLRTMTTDLYTPIQTAINETMGQNVELFSTPGAGMISQQLMITAALNWTGSGRYSGSLIQSADGSGNIIRIESDGAVEIKSMWLQAMHAVAGGRAISLSGGTQNAYSIFRDLVIAGGYDQFYAEAALLWGVEDVIFSGFANYGAHVENTYSPDAGDSHIALGCIFSNAPSARAAIHQASSGGLRITDFKINSCQFGILSEIESPTSDLIIADGSIENVTQGGIAFGHPVGSGSFRNVTIDTVQIARAFAGVLLNDPSGAIEIATMSGCTLSSIQMYGVLTDAIDDLTLGDNTIIGSGMSGSIGLKIGPGVANPTESLNRVRGFAINRQNLSTSGAVTKFSRPLLTYTSGAAAPNDASLHVIATALIPAGCVDVDSAIRAVGFYTFPAGTAAKTLAIWLGTVGGGGSELWGDTFSAGTNVRVEIVMGNVGVLNTQITTAVVTVDGALHSTTQLTTNADFTIDMPMLFAIQKTNGTDTVILTQAIVELLA